MLVPLAAGALAALGGQDVAVTGVGVAPAQVSLELAGQHSVAGVVVQVRLAFAIRRAPPQEPLPLTSGTSALWCPVSW
jgi:hypothetical protein